MLVESRLVDWVPKTIEAIASWTKEAGLAGLSGLGIANIIITALYIGGMAGLAHYGVTERWLVALEFGMLFGFIIWCMHLVHDTQSERPRVGPGSSSAAQPSSSGIGTPQPLGRPRRQRRSGRGR